MTASGYSPGPWVWYGPTRGEGWTFTHEAHVGPGEGNDICGPIAAVGGDDKEQAVANARLIAAAPEMHRIISDLASVSNLKQVNELCGRAKELLDTLPAEQGKGGEG